MLSIAARTLKSSNYKPIVGSLTAIRTKVTLPDLPYGYDVSISAGKKRTRTRQ